jgi:hypothetical protein
MTEPRCSLIVLYIVIVVSTAFYLTLVSVFHMVGQLNQLSLDVANPPWYSTESIPKFFIGCLSPFLLFVYRVSLIVIIEWVAVLIVLSLLIIETVARGPFVYYYLHIIDKKTRVWDKTGKDDIINTNSISFDKELDMLYNYDKPIQTYVDSNKIMLYVTTGEDIRQTFNGIKRPLELLDITCLLCKKYKTSSRLETRCNDNRFFLSEGSICRICFIHNKQIYYLKKWWLYRGAIFTFPLDEISIKVYISQLVSRLLNIASNAQEKNTRYTI